MNDERLSSETSGQRDDLILFSDSQTGQKTPFYVVEQTRIGDRTYLLVTDAPEGDAEALILATQDWEDEDPVFFEVEDDNELEAVAKIFESLLEDTEIRR